MHQRGLKLGIYADFGNLTCEDYPGSIDHLQQDAKTFAEWNIDMLKVDGCYCNASLMAKGYPELGQYLNETGRKIVYSCSWPFYEQMHGIPINYTAVAETCNLWRNFDDIRLTWQSIMSIIDYYDKHQDELAKVNGPGRWNDPDMIIVGNREITLDQSRVQMALWSIWSTPLLMSNDLRFITPPQKEILQNRKVIAINQDPLGIMGKKIMEKDFVRIYRKPVTPIQKSTQAYSYAFAFFNTHTRNYAVVKVNQLNEIGLTSADGYLVEDLFANRSYGRLYPNSTIYFFVPPTGVVMVKATVE
ncbi:unnamed protein product [Soboliphyme baturini]|uniref:Alpha-galactosidase n=1 Tax=Soboliphyme baturini TaxID=241478 RepID=A0A183ICI9_9BILA|nr:unnamed protein product [Soboliphyme baturini]